VSDQSLRARLTSGPPLTPAESVRILRDVAHALAEAHSQGLVHGDIRPESVLLTADGRATLTQAGGASGSPEFLAPEQAAGETVDQRADLYSWGVMAYELFAGAHPLQQHVSPQQLITSHMTESSMSVTRIPIALGVLVMRCMEKNPAARPASAAELLAVLDHVMTPTASGTHSAAPPARRVPVKALVAAAVLLAALIVGWLVLR
jgi:serine/threonine-protein kinase